MGFQEKISIAVEKKGISVRKIAKMAGVSHGTIFNYCNGLRKYPNIETIEKIADVLNISLDDLDLKQVTGLSSKEKANGYTVKEAAKKIWIAKSALNRAIREHKVPFDVIYLKNNKKIKYLIPKKSFDEWLSKTNLEDLNIRSGKN